MKDFLISKYKHGRTDAFLSRRYEKRYAFVGIGQHSLSNLYPVVDYLGVPLKWIVVTDERRARLIEEKFSGVKATADLGRVLADEEVAGVLVAASPQAHFGIATRVLDAGKWLFIEKPPCQSLDELQRLSQYRHAAVGLQKRYAPASKLLKKRLAKDQPLSYTLHYRTGAYPEGNALYDLFIHSIDLAVYLFGKGDVKCVNRGGNTMHVLVDHGGVAGCLELSTGYSWSAADEMLTVVTKSGVYTLNRMENLDYEPNKKSVMGVPLEKVLPLRHQILQLYNRNNFSPTLANNQVWSQGFFGEIEAFVEAVEGRRNNIITTPADIIETYRLLERIGGIIG